MFKDVKNSNIPLHVPIRRLSAKDPSSGIEIMLEIVLLLLESPLFLHDRERVYAQIFRLFVTRGMTAGVRNRTPAALHISCEAITKAT
jgi:hypothetical protein